MNTGTNLFIRAIQVIHLTLLLFIVFGWILPVKSVLKLHLIAVPSIILHWKTNGDRCFLTDLENRLKSRNSDTSTKEGEFIKRILGTIYNPLPSDAAIKIGIYSTMWISWAISALRVAQ